MDLLGLLHVKRDVAKCQLLVDNQEIVTYESVNRDPSTASLVKFGKVYAPVNIQVN